MTTAATTIPKYHLHDFHTFMKNGFHIDLPNETVRIVSELAELVGAPSYVRTPVFPIKGHGDDAAAGDAVNSGSGGGRRKNRPTEIAESDWEAIRAFQKTEIQKKQGIEAHIDNIRAALNKITEKTYDDMFSNICATLVKLTTEENIEDDMRSDVMNRVGTSVFHTASTNTFYSALYARLFKDLMSQHPVFRTIFDKNMDEFTKLFSKIEYIDSKKDYDKFCEINKVNENRKAMSLFIVNLMKEGVVDADTVIDIVRQLQELLWENIRGNGKTNEVDELSENLFIIIKNSCSYFQGIENEDLKAAFKGRVLKVEEVSHLKLKSFPSISNKCIFKHMDIMDEVNKVSKTQKK